MNDDPDNRITYFAKTDHRNAGLAFGIKKRDRRSHMYVVGKTGTGKSHLLRLMIEQDIQAGEGCALFDPHGDLAREVAQFAKDARSSDLIYLDFTDPDSPWRFNPLAGIAPENRALAVAGLIEVFKKFWTDDWGPRLEHLFRNVLFTLLDDGSHNLADILPLLADRDYRRPIVSQLTDPIVRDFWQNEYDRYSLAFRAVVTAPLQNKLGALLTDPLLRRFFTEEGRQLAIRPLMDEGRILVANLDKGQIGEGPSGLLGSLLLSHIALAAVSRSNRPESDRRDFYVYADEFQVFTTLSFASMLAELRKYRVALVLSHQHLSQLDSAIRDAVFGNAGTLVSFRVGAADAAYLAREFAPVFSAEDIIALPRYRIYLKLLIDGETSRPFSAESLPRIV